MKDAHHHDHQATHAHQHSRLLSALDRVALLATLHCLAGCAIGEVAGLVIGTALGWGNIETILLAIALAFISGFALTVLPLRRNGFSTVAAVRVALAADTVSISIMEIVDNVVMMLIPGAMEAPLDSVHFWQSLALSLTVAGIAAFPVNRWLIARGRGHALAHGHH
jgi:hypothetical protein